MSVGTEPIAAAVVGVIVNAMPVPPVSSAGRKFQNVAPASSCANSTSDTATRVMPNPISHLAPIVSVSRPACGAIKTIRSVMGRKSAPVWIGE